MPATAPRTRKPKSTRPPKPVPAYWIDEYGDRYRHVRENSERDNALLRAVNELMRAVEDVIEERTIDPDDDGDTVLYDCTGFLWALTMFESGIQSELQMLPEEAERRRELATAGHY